jgi:acetyl esterase/lipase
LVFVAATPEVPASIYRVRDARASAELMLRFDSITADQIIPNRRRVIDPDRDVVVYRYSNGNTGDGAIIWLHGGSDRFSPRWHVYAQYFAGAGFEFLALNYSEPWPRDVGDYAEQAREVAAMVRSLRREGFRRVFLIGVSTGTQIIQKYLSDDLESVEAVVEFSPVNNEHWESPRILPPLLAFTGENDPLLNHERRVAEIDAHRALGNSIDWIVYDNEGHDLRGRYPIEDRIARTLQFLLGFDTEQSASIDADVAKMPGFDHDPLLLRAQDRSVVSTK